MHCLSMKKQKNLLDLIENKNKEEYLVSFLVEGKEITVKATDKEMDHLSKHYYPTQIKSVDGSEIYVASFIVS